MAIGGDHAGFTYKQAMIEMLQNEGHEMVDFGPGSDASVDYPDHAHPLAISVEKGETDLGILICGVEMALPSPPINTKVFVQTLCWNEELGSLARQHNNANVLCLPARFVDLDLAKKSFTHSFRHGLKAADTKSC